MGQAVALDRHWGKPDHPGDVLGTDPVSQGGNVICRKLADVRLTLLSRKFAAAEFQLIPGSFLI